MRSEEVRRRGGEESWERGDVGDEGCGVMDPRESMPLKPID